MNTNYVKIAKNKSLLKEYHHEKYNNRVVYLKDGDEFQIQLFNPEKDTICARIKVDGIDLSNDIVIYPGQRIWLERYTDTPNKFKFKVYSVDGDDAEVKAAISCNGNIDVSFYRKQLSNYKLYNEPTIYWSLDNQWTNFNQYNNNFSEPYSTCKTSISNDSMICEPLENNWNTTAYPTAGTTATLCSQTVIETGKTTKGDYSNQKFENNYDSFEYYSYRSEHIKILPESRKKFNDTDLRKIYCHSCGRKLKTNYKYCPYCGEKID